MMRVDSSRFVSRTDVNVGRPFWSPFPKKLGKDEIAEHFYQGPWPWTCELVIRHPQDRLAAGL